MRASMTVLLCLFVGSTPAMAADEFCRNLELFAQGLKPGEEREIKLVTEWSAEPVKACGDAASDPPSVRFCDWLFKHTSTEFMEANVNSALACLTGDRWRGMAGSIDFLTGKVHFYKHELRGAKNIIFEIEYSVRHGDDMDMLRIAVTPLDER